MRLGLCLFLLCTGCQVFGRGTLYVEPSINRASVKVMKVAIVPNRLPATLTEPERWRKFNWEVVAGLLRQRGFEIIDYDTSVRTFEKSGLPVEDTHSSRDKYAELAGALGADAIVVPYYATFAYAKNYFMVNKVGFDSVATFQFYLAERNDFMARIDASGESNYMTGILGAGGLVFSLVGSIAGVAALGIVGLVAVVGEVAYVVALSTRSNESYWEEAFRAAITEGMKPFFAAFPRAT